MAYILDHIEIVALTVNILTFLTFVWKGTDPGKAIYWAGTIVVVAGLLKMKG